MYIKLALQKKCRTGDCVSSGYLYGHVIPESSYLHGHLRLTLSVNGQRPFERSAYVTNQARLQMAHLVSSFPSVWVIVQTAVISKSNYLITLFFLTSRCVRERVGEEVESEEDLNFSMKCGERWVVL